MAKMTNPLNDKQFERLTNSITWSNRMLSGPKKNRLAAIKQFVGFHYSEDGAAKRVPVPFLKLAVTVFVRLLAARAPRALITSPDRRLMAAAATFEAAVNKVPEEIDLQSTFRKIVTETIFSGVGCAKIGLQHVGEVLGQPYGETFVDLVTLDDLVIDMSAKTLDQVQYIGNDYWLDYEEVMESDAFPKGKLSGLEPDDYTVIGEHGEERAENITSDESAELFRKKIWLRDVWIPSEFAMVTYAVKTKRRLKTIDWYKDEDIKPYYVLSFDDVPGNLLPLPPVSAWRDIHELANRLFRKLGDQADSEKTVLGFSGNDDEGVQSFRDAQDGDGVKYAGGEPKRLQAGGVNNNTLLFFLQCKDLYSYFASNLDSLGGLSPQSETLGQDRLIAEAAGAQLRDMSDHVRGFIKEVFKVIAYYEWNDLAKSRKLEKLVPGTDMSIPAEWNAQSRIGSFSDYDFDIDIYSMQDDTPATKLQKLGAIMQQYIIPLLPAIQQAGGSFDVQELLRLIGKYSDLPELEGLITWMQPAEGRQGEAASHAPSQTTRRYERVGRPGAAAQGGNDQLMQRLLMGGGQGGNSGG